jgi:hypothetical protein
MITKEEITVKKQGSRSREQGAGEKNHPQGVGLQPREKRSKGAFAIAACLEAEECQILSQQL